MKNIYIATSGEIKHKAQELCTLLEKYGFNITFKWWLSYTQNGNNEYHQMSPKQFKEIDKIQLIGEIDLMAIEKSDWLILINDKNITPTQVRVGELRNNFLTTTDEATQA